MQTLMVQRPLRTFSSRRSTSIAGRRLTQTASRGRLPIQRALIGDVNDPEKSRANKEKKEKDSSWAEPSNSNKLEKKPLAHEGEEAVEEAAAAGEKAKESVSRTAAQAREAVAKLSEAEKSS